MKRTHISITGMALAALASTGFTSLASATSKTNFNITEGGAQKGTCIDAGHVEGGGGVAPTGTNVGSAAQPAATAGDQAAADQAVGQMQQEAAKKPAQQIGDGDGSSTTATAEQQA